MNCRNRSSIPTISGYRETMSVADLEALALQLRREIVEMTRFSGTRSSHLGGELSAVEILAVLYGSILRLDPEKPDWEKRDIFILSKGHCSALQYAAMSWRGFFDRELLWNEFNRLDGRLEEHANMKLPGIDAPTGSLGMGLCNGCGYAWARRDDQREGVPTSRVYVVLGDGECTEGQTWEGALLGAQLKLSNLIAIVDYNKYIITAPTSEVMNLDPLEEKFRSFGWHAQRVDGHDVGKLRGAIETAGAYETAPGKPRVVIADTVKGMPISFIMKEPVKWHAGHLDDALYRKCMQELGL